MGEIGKKVIQWGVFILLQILLIPFILVAIIIGSYKEMVIGKKLGLSFSAGQTLQYRFYMHFFETREDKNSVEFTKKLPSESYFALLSVLGAFIVTKKFFGLDTKLSRIPEEGYETLDSTAGARVLAFDEIIKKYIGQVEQIVLPGVGYDLIALKFTKGSQVKVYEIDQTKTIEMKEKTLTKAGISHDWIRYIGVDYAKESWSVKLIQSGFDPSKKTLFIWQSVCHFLDEDVVLDMIRDMKSLSSPGSIIVQDIYSKAFVEGYNMYSVKSKINLMAKMGEPWKFGLDMDESPKEKVEEFLNTCGLELTNYRQFAIKNKLRPYYCILESKIK